MIDQDMFKKLSVIITLGILAVLSIFIIWPIITAILTGLILAYIFYPVYKKIFNLVKEKNISALIIIFLVLLLIFLPLWLLLPMIVKQVINVYLYTQNINFYNYLTNLIPSLADANLPNEFIASLNTFVTGILSKVISSASSVFLNIPNLLLKTAVVFFVFFFAMRDGEVLIKYVKTLSPFSKSAEDELIKKFDGITKSVIYGSIIIGIIQGLATGLGLFIFGVPKALLLTIVAMLVAIIPVLGAWLVWVPAFIYLIITKHTFSGIGLLLYGAIFVSWVDNIIRPYIVARRIKISSAIVLVGMIGGLIVFGILGLILGPLILSYLLLVLDAYRNNRMPSIFSLQK